MIRIVVLVGAVLGAALWLLLTGLRPAAPPRLDAALARLRGDDTDHADLEGPAGERPGLLARIAGRVAVHVKVPGKDLDLLGISSTRFLTEKALMAGAGLALPTLVAAASLALGLRPPWQVPAGAALLLAAGGWFVPDMTARQNAAARRADFRHALSAYFDVVRLGFAGGLGPSDALERAPHYSGGWAFRRIAEAIDTARYTHTPPWTALARLGDQIGVPELRDLADLVELAGNEGARVVEAITAYTTQMRSRRLAELRYQAGAATTTMTAPIALLGLAFVALAAFPQMYVLLTGT